MEQIRILHIVHILDRGGMESRIMDLYRHLDRSKYQYDFYVESGKGGTYDNEVIDLGGRVYLAEKNNKYNIPDFKQFKDFLKKHQEYKIIYAYNQWAGWYLHKAQRCGIPNRIANARTCIETKSLKNMLKNLLKMNVNKYATHRFAVSKKAAIWLFGDEIFNRGEVEVWPNAINSENFRYYEEVRRDVREELNLKDSFTVIHVGNIRFEKNHSFLLAVFEGLKRDLPNAKLILVGGGDIDKLRLRMKTLNIEDSVMYLGVRQDVFRLLQAGDCFVFPSLYEGFPGAVLEAEASGLNCLISDTITDEVMLTSHIKMMSIKDSPLLWAEAIKNFEETDRKDSWNVIKKAGYDINELIERTEKFYDSILSA